METENYFPFSQHHASKMFWANGILSRDSHNILYLPDVILFSPFDQVFKRLGHSKPHVVLIHMFSSELCPNQLKSILFL